MKKLFQAGAFVYYFSIRLTHLAYLRLIRFVQSSHVAQSSYRSAYAQTQRLSASAHDGVHRLVRWLKIGLFYIVDFLRFVFLLYITVTLISWILPLLISLVTDFFITVYSDLGSDLDFGGIEDLVIFAFRFIVLFIVFIMGIGIFSFLPGFLIFLILRFYLQPLLKVLLTKFTKTKK